MTTTLQTKPVLVIGAGVMGMGIVQVAAQCGHPVFVFDVRPEAARTARNHLAKTFEALVSKGKLSEADAASALGRIRAIDSLAEGASAALVIEAIVEKLEAKQSLFRELEALLDPDCILATNTSSISVTAIASGLKHPGRVVGMHFFNPVPLMKLVEIVSGLKTDPERAQALFQLSEAWGKVPVYAQSTPGFIVNRIARPYYAETYALLQEQAATPAIIDTCLRAAGFRMGPCELMDLIGLDTNFSVTLSVFEAYFFDKRYTPSIIQREMVAGGLLGRKSGEGFYRYDDTANKPGTLPIPSHPAPHTAGALTIRGRGPVADALEAAATQALAEQGWGPARDLSCDWVGVSIDEAHLVLTDGRCAHDWACELSATDVAVFDWTVTPECGLGTAIAYALAAGASPSWVEQAPRWLSALGYTPLPCADAPGLIVARTVAMLVNEACDAVLQGVCSPEGADAAMKLGVNYPAGPFEWLARLGRTRILGVLSSLDETYRGERYRISPYLRRLASIS